MDIGQIFAIAFWASLALSSIVAILGIWCKQRWFLVASAILSLPFVFITVAHPGARYFAGLPILHILAAIAVKGYPRWIRASTQNIGNQCYSLSKILCRCASWALLLVIISLAAVFLVMLFGVL